MEGEGFSEGLTFKLRHEDAKRCGRKIPSSKALCQELHVLFKELKESQYGRRVNGRVTKIGLDSQASRAVCTKVVIEIFNSMRSY